MSEYAVKMMPDEATIIERLTAVREVVSLDECRVISAFASKVASSEEVAPDVNLAFQFAIYDVSVMTDATPYLSVMLNMIYGEYMSALFPDDPAFVAECIAVHNEITKQAMYPKD